MKWIKIGSVLLLPELLLAEEPVGRTMEVQAETNDVSTVKLSENLKTNNPFVPYKSSGLSTSFSATDSSDFDFNSVVEYPDHQEFSLKKKGDNNGFWFSSKDNEENLKHGIKYWNFYPNDRLLVIQNIYSGELINIIQQRPVEITSKFSSDMSNAFSNSNADFQRFLTSVDDEDDEEDKKEEKKGSER